ncbi:MAG: MerR family transcriptional regulator [Deltaproteobacteria bacterium]|jgi:DNA-binding transcriptional MerR regulator|nr:MerR family transcriptional regulator [Deltaproteobacteria bacterium]
MPEKTYKIGEAAQLLNLKSYVLRFWETEFPQLNPLRTESGQRLYSEQDLVLLGRIRHLLHERGLTIEGARKILADMRHMDEELSTSMLTRGYSDYFGEADDTSETYGEASGDVPDASPEFAPKFVPVQFTAPVTGADDAIVVASCAAPDVIPDLASDVPHDATINAASDAVTDNSRLCDELQQLKAALEQSEAEIKRKEALLRQVLAALADLNADLAKFSGSRSA